MFVTKQKHKETQKTMIKNGETKRPNKVRHRPATTYVDEKFSLNDYQLSLVGKPRNKCENFLWYCKYNRTMKILLSVIIFICLLSIILLATLL